MIKITTEQLYGLSQEAIAELERIAASEAGKLTAESIVDRARDPKNPLHDRFEWNDERAGHEYRLEQARSLIRHVKVIYTTPEERTIRVRNFVYQDGGYRKTATVLTRKDSREELLDAALDELESFARKYAALEELSGLRSSILALLKRYRAKRAAV
jgi:hypothetical protein